MTIFLLVTVSFSDYYYKVSNISEEVKDRMIRGNSYKQDCPISLKDLRYLNLTYLDFQGNKKVGELIVHTMVSKEIVDIFKTLYESKYPIYKMELVSNFNGNDFNSIEANNTSAYNCRNIEGTKKYSRHAYGKAIDINPIQNPYISKKGQIYHKESLKYQIRVHKDLNISNDKAMILDTDIVIKMFKKYNWIWGGYWNSIKDYQHFEKRK